MTASRVFIGLSIALHMLFAALLLLAVWRGVEQGGRTAAMALGLGLAIAVVYAVGGIGWLRGQPRWSAMAWMALLTALWGLLVVHIPDAAYLAFPMFFLALHILGVALGTVVVAIISAIAISAIGVYKGWSTGGVVGPLVAALAAVAVAYGYRALLTESSRRAVLIDELVATRAELAKRERESGRDAERARLAGEIHDTVAQGLSSIHLLLHAVERAAPEHPQRDRIELARRTASDSLIETRRFIAALRPTPLEGTTLSGALHRLAQTAAERAEGNPPRITVSVSGLQQEVPVPIASALVRIAQESVGNAMRHSQPQRINIRTWNDDNALHLEVADDGQGFDLRSEVRASAFGIEGMRSRMRDLGGRLRVSSEPGQGTTIHATVPLETAPSPKAPLPVVPER